MSTINTLKIALLFMLLPDLAFAALCSRTLTFADGSVLTAAQLNAEFTNAVDCTNSISNANIATNAAIDPSKISTAIGGNGLTRQVSGALDVNVDNVTIELSGDNLRVKDAAVTTAKINDGAVTRAKIEAAERIPTGVIMPFAGTAEPTGWFLCDGRELSRTTYATLFAIIGITHGQGNGTTTFNIPDYRGRFMRGVDSVAGRDADSASRTAMNSGGNTGNNVGSVQVYGTKRPNTAFTTDNPGDHSHALPPAGLSNATGAGALWSGGYIGMNPTGTNTALTTQPSGTHAHTVTAGGDNETRPLNAYVNYIIKY